MKFKTILMLVAAAVCSMNLFAQEADCTLTVKVKNNSPSDMLFIGYKNRPSAIKIDSASLSKGKCVMKIHIPFAQRAFAYLGKANSGFLNRPRTTPGITFYLEEGNVSVEIGEDVRDIKRSGTKLNDDFQAYSDAMLPFMKKEDQMEKDFSIAKAKKDSVAMKLLQQQYITMNDERMVAGKDFFNKHTDSQIALDWLIQTMDIASHKSEVQAMFGKLSQRLRDTNDGKRYALKIQSTQAVEVGCLAPDFTAKNPKGVDISLKSYRGKYVLVDFWASWCSPCRHENPNVVKAYTKYKSDKFDILGVSLDQNKKAWEDAIAKDGLTWNQVCDFMGWQSVTAMTYFVHSIPANFLIDPQGKIIARDLRGDDLEKKLNEVLK